MIKKYLMLKDSSVDPTLKAGTIVYKCQKPDYGLSSDDSRVLGYECISITLNENGDYPFIVVPVRDLEEENDKRILSKMKSS